MAIYAIADLHLSFKNKKPMDIFGNNWENHEEKIKKSWNNIVKSNDTVLLPGDFSWAMKLEDTYLDFKYLNDLPGNKILLKGNHDYWWQTMLKLNEFIKNNKFEKINFLYNNSYLIENKIICGTRGWSLNEKILNEKMLNREAKRLELSIIDGINKWGDDKEIICMMHYPPIVKNKKDIETNELKNIFLKILMKYGVKKCIYGHLHGDSHKDAVDEKINEIEFKLVSGDYLNFNIYKISD